MSASASALGAGPSALPLYAPPLSMKSGANRATQRPFDEQDPRVYFDRQSATYRCEAPEDGGNDSVVELEWDAKQRAWMPVLDEDLVEAQQQVYGGADDGHSQRDAAQGVQNGESPSSPRKRKQQRAREQSPDRDGRAAKQPRKKINTNVFVSGLPLDATKDEIAAVFSRYGVLYEDDAGEPRVKMYADRRTGMFKGEALITYFKEESVDLAIRVLDESALRAAEGKTDPIMHVSRADFGGADKGNDASNGRGDEAEIVQDKHNRSIAEAGGADGSSHGPKQPPKMSASDKKRAQKRFARMNDKLTDWNSDSDDEELRAVAARAQGSAAVATGGNVRQVCLRKMFSLAELDDEPSLLLDLKEDVREECETMGKVTNVVLWDKEPEGIITVKFNSHAAAMACMQKMDGRFFGGRQIIAHLLEGKPRFRRSGRGEEDEDEEEGEEEGDGQSKRPDAFGEWLEGGGQGD